MSDARNSFALLTLSVSENFQLGNVKFRQAIEQCLPFSCKQDRSISFLIVKLRLGFRRIKVFFTFRY